MKKKLSFMLLAVIIFPVIALFGCDEVVSYPVTVYQSSPNGSVSGNGTYQAGSTVQLTATAKQGSHFIAWIYQNVTELENNETYNITNTLNAENKPSKSVLTFTMNENTQGSYTAVFSEKKVMYVKFDGMWLSTSADSEPVESDPLSPILMAMTMDLSQGSSAMLPVYEVESLEMRENVLVRPEKMLSVLRLQPTSTQHIRANTTLHLSNTNININFRADINFQESTEEIDGSNFSYQVKYAEGSYKIIFKFTLPSQTYYFVLRYKSL